MATDRITICNRALLRLGANVITSFADQTTESDYCSVEYFPAKAELLAAHPWNFAQKVTTLSKHATPVSADFAASYVLPVDYVAMVEVQTTAGYRTSSDWRVRGKSLVSEDDSDSGVQIVYTADAPEQNFSPWFTEALVLKLAAVLAGPITESDQTVERFVNMYQATFAQARFRDSQQDPSEPFTQFPLIEAHAD